MPKITASTKFRNKIWEKGALKSVSRSVMKDSAQELETKLKVNINSSTPAGRLYRRRAITGRRTQKAIKQGFRPVKGASTRIVVGYRFHRASAWGQPPARDTDTLYKSLKVRRNGDYGIKASVKAPGVKFLDDPDYLNRLFFAIICQAYFNNEFKTRMRAELNALTKQKRGRR